MSQGTRKKELSLLNLLFCILVVLIHCLSQPVSVLDRSSWQYALVLCVQRLAFVSVPGFFFLSGLKLTLFADRHRSLMKYWLGRVRTILLPYILAVAIYYLYFWTHHYFPFSLADFGGYLVRGDLSSHFYFVVTLVQFIVLTPLFLWLARRFDPVVLLPFALGLTWLGSLYLQAILTSAAPDVTFPYGDRVFLLPDLLPGRLLRRPVLFQVPGSAGTQRASYRCPGRSLCGVGWSSQLAGLFRTAGDPLSGAGPHPVHSQRYSAAVPAGRPGPGSPVPPVGGGGPGQLPHLPVPLSGHCHLQ